MRVLVCGGRNFNDWFWLSSALNHADNVFPFEFLICGMARGADSLADMWAKHKGIPVIEFPAPWRAFGRAAGVLRNTQMLQEGKPSVVIAFPGGRGTANMIAQATAANIEVWNLDGSLTIEEIINQRGKRSAGIERT